MSRNPPQTPRFDTQGARRLPRLLQEATRATPESGPDTYVPPSGGEAAEANYHHFIFGQRGSGKSSLLRYLQHQMFAAGRVAAWIDEEIFSNLSYPDVLVTILHELMKNLIATLEQKMDADGGKRRKFSLRKNSRGQTWELLDELRVTAAELEKLKFAPLNRKIEWKVTQGTGTSSSASAGLRMELVGLQARAESTDQTSATSSETVDGTKEEYLERALTGYRDLIIRTAHEVGGGFVFVDDLYQIRREDQPQVLGYLHRLVKDTGLWLKIGSIRYSTITFKAGNPPRGMQRGHDAHEVALDRGLSYFQLTQNFLEKILSQISQKVDVDIHDLLTEDARKRLVLAAGGVARDYLRLTAGAIEEARNRGVTKKTGSHRVIVEDINKAAGFLSPAKFEDLKVDEPQEAIELSKLVRKLTEFCRDRKSAYFLIAADETELSGQVDKLQHLRFTHLLVANETIPDRGSQRFNVWLLDVAELSAQRATTGMDFLGWDNREKRRNRRLIFTGSEPDLVAAPPKRKKAAKPPTPPKDQAADNRLF
jgi:hypothetical protein